MPILGLGTWQAQGDEVTQAIETALSLGYRHIDTAKIYGNEADIGRALAATKISRKDIFVTTKLWNDDHADPRAALKESLKRLGLDYVDLYLIHWPVPARRESWKVLEELYNEGLCRAIGVSNFTIKHLTSLLATAKVIPAVNQVEFTPFLFQKELLDFCTTKGVALTAYSPLSRAQKFRNATLSTLGRKHKKTPAQIMLRWDMQHGIIAIPKSTSREHLQENSEIFDFSLDAADMNELDSLNENLRLCWNPEEWA